MTPVTARLAAITYCRYVTFSRAARISVATLATGVTAALLAAVPAQAAFAIPVNCEVDNVVLSQDGATYTLYGTCGNVTVTGDNVTVTEMPATRRLRVLGVGDTVSSKPVDLVVVRGRDNQVNVRSARIARLASPGSTLRSPGLLETVRVPGNRGRVHAERMTKLVVDGNRNAVRVDRGATIVHDDGRHNRIRVHKHA